MNTAYIGIGSNQHNPKYHVIRGIREINHSPKIDIQKKSSLYETLPLGPQNQPNFINAVIKITTSYQPTELLKILQSIERKHHRKRVKKWGPRTLDLDILIYDDIILDSDKHEIGRITSGILTPLLFEISASFKTSVIKLSLFNLKSSLLSARLNEKRA